MPQPDQRSKLATGFDWASRVTTIGLEFALPPIAGYEIDRIWKTIPLFTLLLMLLGFAVGMMHILRIAGKISKP